MNYLTNDERSYIKDQMNPAGHNFKDVNWIKLLSRTQDGVARVEVGYWITYVGCRPKYQKEVLTFKL